jgi:hypothetical protein
MSVSDIIADEPGSRHNVSCFAGPVGHPSDKVASHMSYVGCSADFLSAYTLYELIIYDRISPRSARCADMRLVSACLHQGSQMESCITRQQHADNRFSARSR